MESEIRNGLGSGIGILIGTNLEWNLVFSLRWELGRNHELDLESEFKIVIYGMKAKL